jgi:hypothetical protein
LRSRSTLPCSRMPGQASIGDEFNEWGAEASEDRGRPRCTQARDAAGSPVDCRPRWHPGRSWPVTNWPLAATAQGPGLSSRPGSQPSTTVDHLRTRIESGARVSTVVCDLRQLDLAEASADAVLLLGPLSHLIDHHARIRSLAELRRVLHPGGLAFIAAISRWSPRLNGIVGSEDRRNTASCAGRDRRGRSDRHSAAALRRVVRRLRPPPRRLALGSGPTDRRVGPPHEPPNSLTQVAGPGGPSSPATELATPARLRPAGGPASARRPPKPRASRRLRPPWHRSRRTTPLASG